MSNPEGPSQGGKVHIDGACNLFRRFNPDVVTLAANPVPSLQRDVSVVSTKATGTIVCDSRYPSRRSLARHVMKSRGALGSVSAATGVKVSRGLFFLPRQFENLSPPHPRPAS